MVKYLNDSYDDNALVLRSSHPANPNQRMIRGGGELSVEGRDFGIDICHVAPAHPVGAHMRAPMSWMNQRRHRCK